MPGSGKNPVSLQTIIVKLEKLLNKKTVFAQEKPFHKTDMKETWADIEKANKLLGWQPKVSLETGLKLTVNW